MRNEIVLPKFEVTIDYTLIDAVLRYAKSEFSPRESISIGELSKLLFATQGCTRKRWGLCFKTVPSAGATFPLEIFAVCYSVERVNPAIYVYSSHKPFEGKIEEVAPISTIFQSPPLRPLDMVVVAHYERTTSTYGHRGYRYVYNEVGHCMQNVVLEAMVLGMSCGVKVLTDESVRKNLRESLRTEGDPLALLQIGIPLTPSRDTKVNENSSLVPLEEAIVNRRSIRSYSRKPLSLEWLMLILKYSIGTIYRDKRPYPKVSDNYLVECIVLVRDVEGLEEGIYHYDSQRNELKLVKRGYYLDDLYRACLHQDYVRSAQCSLVFTTSRDADQFLAHLETGMIGQNVYLLVASMGLGTVAIGAFYDEEVKSIIDVDLIPTYVMPIGTL